MSYPFREFGHSSQPAYRLTHRLDHVRHVGLDLAIRLNSLQIILESGFFAEKASIVKWGKSMEWVFRIMTSVALVGCLFSVSPAQTLIIGTPEWKPWQITDGEHPSGITIDILQELAKRTGYTMDIKPLPHKRMMVEFEMQQITAEPSVNPVWREDQQDISVYTTPYCTTCDIILVRNESGITGTCVQDFHGLLLGCGLGYYYPEGFQEAFARGEIVREDTPMGEKNLMKLALKRIDGAILDKIQAKYMLKVFKMNPDDFDIAYEFQPSKLSLRLHISKRHLLPPLDEAIVHMRAEGTVARILTKYSE